MFLGLKQLFLCGESVPLEVTPDSLIRPDSSPIHPTHRMLLGECPNRHGPRCRKENARNEEPKTAGHWETSLRFESAEPGFDRKKQL